MITDTTALPIVDMQRAFSKSAVVAFNLGRNTDDNVLKVDNAYRAGYVAPKNSHVIARNEPTGARGAGGLSPTSPRAHWIGPELCG